MALTSNSLFLYNFQITQYNSSLDFRAVSGGPILQATLNFGFYSLSSLMTEVVRAMAEVDPAHLYTVTADRTILGGTQNRVTIQTSYTYLDLLFATGPRASTSCATILGYTATDKTGATSYTGSSSAGTTLQPDFPGYNYQPPMTLKKIFGAVNVSASGVKEAVVFKVQRFIEVQFKYEPLVKSVGEWDNFFTWAIQQREFDFTPEIASPSVFYNVTLEKTSTDPKGLGFVMKEMIAQGFPFYFDTGLLTFRIKE